MDVLLLIVFAGLFGGWFFCSAPLSGFRLTDDRLAFRMYGLKIRSIQ